MVRLVFDSENYISVEPEQMILDGKFKLHIFVRIGEKLIQIFKTSDEVDMERLDHYRAKAKGKIYVSKEAYLSVNTTIYHTIRRSLLFVDEMIDFDVYVFEDDEYQLFASRKDKISKSQIEELVSRKHRKLYFVEDDENAFLEYVRRHLNQAMEAPDVEVEVKSEILLDATEDPLTGFLSDPNPDTLRELNITQGSIAHFVRTTGVPGVVALLQAQETPSLHSHSVQVATLAGYLYDEVCKARVAYESQKQSAQKWDLPLPNDEETMKKVELAALLHDVGRAKYETSTQNYQLDRGKVEDQVLLNHPGIGEDLIRHLDEADGDVMRAVLEHEEMYDGSGTPKGIIKRSIAPMSQIISISNYYDNLLNKEKLSPEQARDRMYEVKAKFNPTLYKLIQPILNEGLEEKSFEEDFVVG